MRHGPSAALQLQTLLDPAGISTAADIAMILVGAAIFVVSVVLVRLALKLTNTLKSVNENLGPVSDRVRSISDNVEFITQALRTDVERLNASVKVVNNRLHQASGYMEKRIEEFNALMEVIQGEAEGVFIKTAAAVRGVREGAQVLGRTSRSQTADAETREEDTDIQESELLE